MDNVVILTSSDSDSDFSDESDGHSDREEEIYDSEHFMNHVNKKEYEINRNKLFTKDIEEVDIMVDSKSQSTTDKDHYEFKLDGINSNTGGLGEFKNVIGINLLKCCLISNSSNTAHFADVIVPEIPYKSCIHNADGNHLIARLCMKNSSAEEMVEYEPEKIKENYFFPITLSKLSINIYKAGSTTSYGGGDNTFIFRLTILKNLDLLK